MNLLYKGTGAVFVKDTAENGYIYLGLSTETILILHITRKCFTIKDII